MPRDYKTSKYHPLLYEESSLRYETTANNITNKLPTIDDVEILQKSIVETSLIDDKINMSKESTSLVPNLLRENDKKYYDFLQNKLEQK